MDGLRAGFEARRLARRRVGHAGREVVHGSCTFRVAVEGMQIFDAGLDARVEFGCWRAGGKPAFGFVHAGVFTELRLRSGGNVVRVARRTRSRGGKGTSQATRNSERAHMSRWSSMIHSDSSALGVSILFDS